MESVSGDPRRDLARLRVELERYKAATEAGLDSLDEAIGYLERSRRTSLARVLRQNRRNILRRLGSGSTSL